ncbi:FGGY-family carbohydrate kinase [Vibrio nigripulchritudo]|uniref:FGGY-family carbohydrate kinase n=1 Tax=Vibrio nigripulchritudo TaxID=28173 RepID=UPI00248F9C34|nr:FGGY-family carbohydrate kinase [Vibrio nigripulchritudo]BDU40977.1 carbohydrate kinase [Vibrio nigripulchritudo]BDU46717.1 carbohydrate kinase [Vibrio nigripulchritudo]
MGRYILGLDCGNTAIKAALLDMEGVELASHASTIETLFPHPGHTELDMSRLWQQCCEVIWQVLKETRISGDQIIAIGVSGHGNGAYLLDKRHQPLLGIQSLDSRATDLVADIQSGDKIAEIRELNRQGVWASQTATLLSWLKQNQPETYHQTGTVFFCKDYLNFCLTGERYTDYSDLSASGLFDFPRHQVSKELLTLLDIQEITEAIPTPVHSDEIIGKLSTQAAEESGLDAGTPVIAGMIDVIASALGAGVWDENDASIVTGTWSINQVVTNKIPDKRLFMTCLFPDNRYLAIESSATSASNLEWFVQEFFQFEKAQLSAGESIFELCNQLVESVEISETLPLFHPYLYGSGDSGAARGNFFDLAGWHKKTHLLYAVYEGIVFGHLEHVNKLRTANIGFTKALLSGGGARSQFWCQLFADVLNIDIHITQCNEAGAKGVAMAAAHATGQFLSFEEAVKAMRSPVQVFTPEPTHQATLKKRYDRYLQVSDWINHFGTSPQGNKEP